MDILFALPLLIWSLFNRSTPPHFQPIRNFKTPPPLILLPTLEIQESKRNPYLPLHCKTDADMTSNELHDAVEEILLDMKNGTWLEKKYLNYKKVLEMKINLVEVFKNFPEAKIVSRKNNKRVKKVVSNFIKRIEYPHRTAGSSTRKYKSGLT